ncbi:MAG TPA: hypothetical protein ENG03_04840 [Thioploca sp.]|nr:hypothetical protein [Thioploca sp.]
MIRVILLLILLVGLTGLLAVWQIQMPEAGQTMPVEDDTWKLPTEFQAHNLSKTYTKLRKLNPWGTDNQTNTSKQSLTQPQKQPTSFQFVGIIGRDNQRYILLLENQKITQYSLKSSLPNGAQILKIHKDAVEIMQDEQIQLMRLYR